MHILVAGSTGVLGRRVVPALVGAGHRVTALTRRPEAAADLRAHGAEVAFADVFDREALTRVVGRAEPDVVMHQLTDLSAVDLAANARMRVVGTRNLVDAAQAAGVRRIVAQSIAWVYEAGDEPADETTPLDDTSVEPRRGTIEGVIALERAVRELPGWVVLRYGLLYGPGTWFAADGIKAADARAGRLPGGPDVSSFVHVDDAAAAAVAALHWPSGVVNVVDDQPATADEWVPAFARAVGAPPPAAAAGVPHAPWARGADNHLARKHRGWIPTHPSWRSGFDTL
ncbi:dTDP-glucose 4,6-dehydratase [Embleya scabrispora]|uniref:dTDP-glucose 4,6-dehydratase n=1 Tax=Embleya scabrispora TaxID=159449 RepID=A0A1T3NM48_9ACTN|nr:NAD-dependent epimerase/dehydratase family protein [Embleya scabrispora]OPC77778.1 dTDP-glucose 4,6-dehydratase [Embleya scabrispora]